MRNRKSYKVGDWTVDPDLNRLSSGAHQKSLRPKTMELLVFLVGRSPAVSSIDDIIEHVWAGRPMTTGPVYNCLNELRQAFDDDKQNPRYIETISRRGYRLIAPITVLEEAEAVTNEAPEISDAGSAGLLDELKRESSGSVSKSGHSGAALNKAIIVGLLVIVAFYTWERFQPSGENIPPDETVEIVEDISIAVLPFIDLSPDGDHEYFALGISEEILNVIAGYPDLKVVGRTSSFQFKGQDIDLRKVGEQLGVAYVIEGSVRRSGDELRITAQMIQAKDGFHLWSRNYDVGVGQVFQIQDEIAASVVNELLQTFAFGEVGAVSPRSSVPTEHFNAYDLFLLARARVNGGTMPELEEAVEFLEQALEIDPEYADAHAELAYAYVTMKNLYRYVDRQRDWSSEEEKMVFHADLALELDPSSANAHFVKASAMNVGKEGVNTPDRLAEANALYKRAIELNPNHARAHLWLAGSMRDMRGSWRKRQEPARKAIELDPLWPFAKQFYLSLIAEMPGARREKWEILRRLKAGQEDWGQREMTVGREAEFLATEGRYAEALSLGDDTLDEMTDGGALQRAYVNTFFLIGSPEKIPTGIEFRSPVLAHLFPGEFDKGIIPYSEACLNPERQLQGFQYATCAYEEMLRGNFDYSREILENNLEVSLLDFTRYRDWHRTLNDLRSPAITMAVLEKLDGNHELAMAYTDIEEQILNSESEIGAIESPVFSRTRARIHALRGENEKAIDELEKMIFWGAINFRIFMEPVFNDLRGHPRYETLKERWIGRINDERTKLGWEPLALNPEAGPGKLPFLLNQ